MINSHALNWQMKMGKQNFFCLLALKHVILALLVTSVKSKKYVCIDKCTEYSIRGFTRYICGTSSDSRFNISLDIQKSIENIPSELIIDCNEYQEDNYTEFIKGLNISIKSILTVSINNCPVPNIPFFKDFLKIHKVEKLNLDNMTKGFRLQRYHFTFLRSSIKTLRIWKTNITDLPEGLFERISNLEELTLIIYQCVKLPAKLFKPLKQLQKLTISCVHLTSLETEIFKHLKNLKFLSIQNSQLQDLPESVFSSLQNLECLVLHSTNISSLQNPIFDNLRKLKSLNIQYNSRLTHLSNRLLQNNIELNEIYITNNVKLSNLPEMLFHNLTSIAFISLSDNQLTNLTENHFKGLPTLETLELTGNNLTENALKSLKENLKNVTIIDGTEG